jgi:ceramide glucosyltransferase
MVLASLIGTILLFWAAWLMPRRARAIAAPPASRSITILKPLHGGEPRLLNNLASAIEQDYSAAIELICGVARADDPAIATVERLRSLYPDADIQLIIDPRRHGGNAKVSNLANMMTHARHDLIVLADSDMSVPRDYLATLVAALGQPGVGAVSCLYTGRGDAGFWSRLVALGIDLHFLPATLIGLATRMAHPCMGSTIAMDRATLAEIGGFERFADTLADDYAIGTAVRASGRRVAIPDMLLTHGCAETSFMALLRQERRWNATIARIDPAGFAGSLILHPFALGLIAWLLAGGALIAGIAVILAFVSRAAIALRLAGAAPRRRDVTETLAAIGLIPLRDLLSFGLFLTGFVTGSVDWRGTDIKLGRKGQLSGRKDIFR